MRKLLLMAAVIFSFAATAVAQQGTGDPAAAMARMKERVKPILLEKTKLTEAQVDKVIEISFEQQRQRRELRNDATLSEEDRKKKTDELDTAREKRYAEIPLTPEQIKAVNEAFAEMRRNAPQRNQ